MARITYIPNRVIDINGIADGAAVHVYQTGTTTPVPLFLDEDFTVPTSNPYVVFAGAAVPPLYHNYPGDIRLFVVSEAGTVQDEDPYVGLGVSANDLASTAEGKGAALIGFEQTGDGAIPETVDDVLQRVVWVESFLVNGGVGDQTAAFQAAINALPARGGIVRFRGTYSVGTTTPINFPPEPKQIRLTGEGKLLQGAANAPMIRKVPGISRCYGAQIDGFTVVAHVDSTKANSANIAVNLHGFDSSVVNIRAEGNETFTSTNGRFYAVVSGHSDIPFCYNNSIRVIMTETAGPAKVVWLHDNGAGTLANANLNKVSVWTYALDGCDIAVDCAKTTQTIVHDSLFEDCPGMTGVLAGNFTTTRDNWFELVAVAINYQSSVTLANNCVSDRDQFSGSNTIVIHSDVLAFPEFRNPLFGGMTFQDQSAAATKNYTVVKPYVVPALPTIGWVLNAAALSVNAITTRIVQDHHGLHTVHLNYTATPGATGRSIMSVTPPAGYKIVTCNVGAEEVGTGTVNVALSTDPDGKNYVMYWPNTNAHLLQIEVTMKAVL